MVQIYGVLYIYQAHGAYAHLHQHNNEEVTDSISDAMGSPLPCVWDPLCLSIPYQYLSALLFKPPDCYFGRWIAVISIMMIHAPSLPRSSVPHMLTSVSFAFQGLSLQMETSSPTTCHSCHGGQNIAKSFHLYIWYGWNTLHR